MYKWIAGILLVASLSACSRPPEPGRDVEKRIDSLTRAQTTLLEAEIDSLCALRMDSLVGHYVDSLLPGRLEKIQSKINQLNADSI